jgi:hypothetical protein
MSEDDLMKEIWRIKDENAAKYDFDVRRMMRSLRERQSEGGCRAVSRPSRKPVLMKRK